MLKNHFTSPTAGYNDSSADDLHARVHRLEERWDGFEKQFAATPKTKKKPSRWKKFWNRVAAVAAVITLILALVPKTINAMANFKAACA